MSQHPPALRLLGPLLALCLGGCGVLGGIFGKGAVFGGHQEVAFRISEDLNDNYPVAVELIVLYDKDLDDELSALTAQQWFAKREQVLRDFSSQQLVTFRWEWTPGQAPPLQRFRYRSGARSLLLFAGYSSPGEHRIRLEVPDAPLQVRLEKSDFRVTNGPHAASAGG
jgi:type VI secretion system protein